MSSPTGVLSADDLLFSHAQLAVKWRASNIGLIAEVLLD
jgi:hypothetical protein